MTDNTCQELNHLASQWEARDSHTFATLQCIRDDGWLVVRDAEERLFACLWLDPGGKLACGLTVGDRVLVLRPGSDLPGVVLGRVTPFKQCNGDITIDATNSLSLRCGSSSIDLRADGKVLIKGDDVTVRAKGTKRIRAGSVSIN